MDPTPELAATLDRDRREAAQMMTLEERSLGGVVLFDILVDAMRGILRVQNPRVDAQAIEQMIVERLRGMCHLEVLT